MTFTSSSSTARFLLLIAAAYTVTASAMIGEVLDTNRRQASTRGCDEALLKQKCGNAWAPSENPTTHDGFCRYERELITNAHECYASVGCDDKFDAECARILPIIKGNVLFNNETCHLPCGTGSRASLGLVATLAVIGVTIAQVWVQDLGFYQ